MRTYIITSKMSLPENKRGRDGGIPCYRHHAKGGKNQTDKYSKLHDEVIVKREGGVDGISLLPSSPREEMNLG